MISIYLDAFPYLFVNDRLCKQGTGYIRPVPTAEIHLTIDHSRYYFLLETDLREAVLLDVEADLREAV